MFPVLSSNSPANLELVGYAALFALVVMAVYVPVLITALLADRAQPEEVARAVFHVLLQFFGAVLMTMSGLAAVIGVFAGVDFPPFTYLVFLMVFGFGGIIFLRSEHRLRAIDPASKTIPLLLYRFTLKFIGIASGFLGGYTLLSYLVYQPVGMAPRWWVNPLVIFLYGIFLAWSVRKIHHADAAPSFSLPSLEPLMKKRKK
ncbi:MAG: hypothetical protein WCV62_04895 [Candidatus Peribacteraceae bacterium]|jgi:hypothetical protein